MTDEERREKRRAKWRRKYARRRARMLGLPEPEFAVSNRGGRPRRPEDLHFASREFLLLQRKRQIEQMRQKRREAGVLSREEKRHRRLAAIEERKRAAIAAFPIFLVLLLVRAKWMRERQLERYRRATSSWRARHPDERRDYDRRYRAENKEKVLAAGAIRKARAAARGYRWKPTKEYIARQKQYARELNLKVTAAHRYLIAQGVAEWWGPGETSQARRQAAYIYVKKHGLLP